MQSGLSEEVTNIFYSSTIEKRLYCTAVIKLSEWPFIFDKMIHNEQEYRTMFDLERRLWWYRVLYKKILQSLKYLPKDAPILDIGCGTGGVIQYLMEQGFQQVRGIDVSPVSIKVCQERGLPAEAAEAWAYLKSLPDHSLQVILFIDSLTYTEESTHEQIIKECARVLTPGGKIILNSAALEAFRGIHDEHVATLCRLNKQSYKRYAAAAAGLCLSTMHYWPFFLGVPIYFIRSLQRYKMRKGKAVTLKTDLEMPAAWLNECFYQLTRAERFLQRFSLFGSSLFAEFTKPV